MNNILNSLQGSPNGVEESVFKVNLQLFAEEGEGNADSGDTGGDSDAGDTGTGDGDGKDTGGNVGESKDSGDSKSDSTKDTADKEGEGDPKKETADLLADWKPKLPDGVELDQKAYDAVMPVFKDIGINAEQADKLTGLYQELTKDFGSQIMADIDNQCKTGYDEAVKEIKADKKLGGKAFEQNVGHVNAMLEKYGGKEAPERLQTALTALAGFDKGAVKPLFTALIKLSQDWADPQTKMGSAAKADMKPWERAYPSMKT